jgi:hypothetical protein
MRDHFRPGQRISARELNALAARAEAPNIMGGNGVNVTQTRNGTQVTVTPPQVNLRTDASYSLGWWNGGADLPPYTPVIIDGTLPPSDDDQAYDRTIGILRLPTADDTGKDFAITTDAHQPSIIQKICYAGIYWCIVQSNASTTATEVKCGINSTVSGALLISSSGTAKIIWEDPAIARTSPHFALIQFGNGGGGTGDVRWVRFVGP